MRKCARDGAQTADLVRNALCNVASPSTPLSDLVSPPLAADPIVYGALDKKGTGILFECPVARSSYRGNPDHPFRKHPVLQIRAIPTLINWLTGDRLVEEECYDTAKVAAFFGVSQ